ncbi:MAG: putative monovalent cation/H+ antiporter subunit [Rickettsiaceae bacterium]|jgi:multicomponent Na+:H+ antiporter subunit C|nr:putative monovalent cation/H+ antiporter subunit [Rickettsiaceae bacterium]
MIIINIVYITAVLTFAAGLYLVQVSDNFFRKMIGLSILQSGVLIFYIAIAKLNIGAPPVLPCLIKEECPVNFTNPLPHVLMLTAIVVGLATLSVGLALIYRIYENFNSLNESEINLSQDDTVINQ